MSKTIDLQIEKCRTLIEGLRKNMVELGSFGISNEDVDKLEGNLAHLQAASRECDELRATLSGKVKAMNDILSDVKSAYAENKKKIKANYPQERWMRYGVVDKR